MGIDLSHGALLVEGPATGGSASAWSSGTGIGQRMFFAASLVTYGVIFFSQLFSALVRKWIWLNDRWCITANLVQVGNNSEAGAILVWSC